ncbi:MAG: DNA-binding response regulator [Caldilinea sp. CFX5]|nr:DNA-binding response regulator [Caldilinea sp. CFX5]
MQANIYLVEDHPLMLRMTAEFINRMPDLQVCGTAATAQEALTDLPTATVDLVLVDVSLPDMDGIQLVSALRSQQPALRCLMLSGHQEQSYVQRALAVGARGYIAKGNPLELIDAIRRVLKGDIYLSAALRTLAYEVTTG